MTVVGAAVTKRYLAIIAAAVVIQRTVNNVRNVVAPAIVRNLAVVAAVAELAQNSVAIVVDKVRGKNM